MSSSNEKHYYLELTRYTLRAVRTAGPVVEFCRECPLEQKPLIDDMLGGLGAGSPVRAVVAVSPSSLHWHVANEREAVRYRKEAELRTFAAGLPHGFTPPLEFVSCNAHDGSLIAENSSVGWLLGVTPVAVLAAERATAKERGIEPLRVESATLGRIGAVATTLRLAGSGHVLLWELGQERSQVFLVTPRGVEAVAPCAAGFDTVFGAVQAALGLKFRGAASRLFFNEGYDFSEAATKIGAELAPALKATVASLLAPGASAELACSGFTNRQSWLLRETARAAGLPLWAPDGASLLGHLKLRLTPGTNATPEMLGLLHLAHLAATRDVPGRAWHPAWSRSEPAAASAPASALQPAAVPGIVENVAPATVVEKGPAKPALTEAAAVSTAARPAAKPKSDAAPEKPAKTEAKTAPKAEEKPAGPAGKAAVAEPAATPVKPKPESAKAAEPAASAVAAAAPVPARPQRKRGYGLYAAIAAGLVCAAVAGKFYLDAQAAEELAETQREEAARVAKAAEERARELEAKAKAEAERIRKEAGVAVALARRQAEEQTRQKVTAELEAERIANSPGILIVTTQPVGADISIDGGALQKSPLSLNDIMPGTHRVVIAMPGYESVALTAEIKGTQTTDLGLIRLERAMGTLVVGSTPDGVDFTVRRTGGLAFDTGRSGRTPAQFEDMMPGDYVVTFTRAGWADRTENVTVAKRETVRAATAFRGGVVQLTSVPSGATVKRDGAVMGTTPLEVPDLSPGKVSYEFALAGYEPLTVTGEVKDGQRVRLDGRLLAVDRIANSSEVKTPPQPYETPSPRIGRIADDGVAEVKVSFVVWRDGTLREVATVGAVDKELAKRCLEAVSRWKFRPALGFDGRPLNVRVALPIKITE